MLNRLSPANRRTIIGLIFLGLSILFHLVVLGIIYIRKVQPQDIRPNQVPLANIVVTLSITAPQKSLRAEPTLTEKMSPTKERKHTTSPLPPDQHRSKQNQTSENTRPDKTQKKEMIQEKIRLTTPSKVLVTKTLGKNEPKLSGTVNTNKKRAKTIDISRVLSNISSTLEEIKDENLQDSSQIFDPRLKKQIHESQQYFKPPLVNKNKRFAVIERGADANIVRLGERCLRVPVEASYDPDNLRIMSFESNCPRQKKSAAFNIQSLSQKKSSVPKSTESNSF